MITLRILKRNGQLGAVLLVATVMGCASSNGAWIVPATNSPPGWPKFHLQARDLPIGPYSTLKAQADTPEGPWIKRADLYLMFFSRLDIALSKNLNNDWRLLEPTALDQIRRHSGFALLLAQ